LMRRPGVAVAIALNGPPLAWPGLRSNVSVWLGPPAIQSKMHERRRRGSAATSSANVSIQPDSELATTPAADRPIQSRRESDERPDSLRRFMVRLPERAKRKSQEPRTKSQQR